METLIRQDERYPGITMIDLVGRLASAEIPELEDALGLVSQGSASRVLLNFAQVTHVSSAALRVLLKTLRDATAQARTIALYNLNPHVEQILKLAGFDQFFQIYPDEDTALVEIGKQL